MRLFEMFFPKATASAAVAKERLQLVLAHERLGRGGPDFLGALQRDLIAAVRKYVDAKDEAIDVRIGRTGAASVLEINIELPPRRDAMRPAAEAAAHP